MNVGLEGQTENVEKRTGRNKEGQGGVVNRDADMGREEEIYLKREVYKRRRV